jgi:putative acetyltransferase
MAQPPAITVRPYRDADLDAVISVFLASIREIAIRDYSQAQIAAWAQVDRNTWKQARSDRPTWVALDSESIPEKIIGFAGLQPNGHLDMMYVHPSHQRHGVASALLSTVEQAAKESGISTLTVDASLTARPFFEKHGFKIIRQQKVPIQGQFLRNLHMSKTLS